MPVPCVHSLAPEGLLSYFLTGAFFIDEKKRRKVRHFF
jgi:hypothetical protein